MTGFNRLKAQDRANMRAGARQERQELSQEEVRRVCLRSQMRRQQYWCAEHSEPRVVCGCEQH